VVLELNSLVEAQLHVNSPDKTQERPIWSRLAGELVRMRFQVLGGLFVAGLLPALIVHYSATSDLINAFHSATIFANFSAFIIGFYIFRNVSSFPGVRATSFIIPSFSSAYVITSLFLVVTREEFSKLQMLLSFALSVGFLFGVFFAIRRVRRPVLAVVPFGNVAPLFELNAIDWRLLTNQDTQDHWPIVADLRAELPETWVRFIAESALQGRPVYNVKQVIESLGGRVEIEHLSENHFGSLAPNEIYASAKRYIDFVASLAFIALTFWMLLGIAIAIRLETPGPAIYRQKRMGQGGLIFTIYKFRSMRRVTPEEEGDNTHSHDAVRITRLGSILRRSRLDELPQILNIMRGEMSWIGPRPEAVSLSEQYEAALPFYRYRHVVRPGITGWAQVNQGHVVGTDAARLKLQYDFFYIRNFSLWLDVLVALKTLRVIFTGSGAR